MTIAAPPLPPEALGGYAGWPVAVRYTLALVLAPIVVGASGMVLEIALRRTYGRDPLYGLLLTFGAALVIEEAIRLIWGSQERVLAVPARLLGPVAFGDVFFAKYRFYAAGAAMLAIVLLWLFIERTSIGARIKAGAFDSELVRALGINLPRLRLLVFALGIALAAFAGIVMLAWGTHHSYSIYRIGGRVTSDPTGTGFHGWRVPEADSRFRRRRSIAPTSHRAGVRR